MELEELDDIDMEDDAEMEEDAGENMENLSDAESVDKDDDRPVRFKDLNIDASLPSPKMLQEWYPRLSPVELDLVSQLAGTNLCFVQAESLLINLIVDKDYKTFATEPQFIHMVYAIERVLKQLEDSGCLIRLVFFNAVKEFFAGFGNSIWALREALLLHFRARARDCIVFQHWFSGEWKSYVKEFRPSFILLSDAMLPDVIKEDEDEETGHLGQLMRSLISSTFYLKVHVALVDGLRRNGNRLHAFSLGPENHNRTVYRAAKSYFPPFIGEEENKDEEQPEVSSLASFIHDAKEMTPNPGVRTFLLCGFCERMLDGVEDGEYMGAKLKLLIAKTLVLMEVVMQTVPLTTRAFATVGDWRVLESGEPVFAGLGRFFEYASKRLKLIDPEILISSGGAIDACDLFDARLYRQILSHICDTALKSQKQVVDDSYFKLEAYAAKIVEFMWGQMVPGADVAFWPINIEGLNNVLSGLQPPALEIAEKQEKKPRLHKMNTHLKNDIFHNSAVLDAVMDEVDVEDWPLTVSSTNFLPSQQWCCTFFMDSVEYEQKMEKNKAIARFEERFSKKTHLTQKDLRFKQQFFNKQRQLVVRALNKEGASLIGTKPLHKPIILNKGTEEAGSLEAPKARNPIHQPKGKEQVETKKDLIVKKKEEEELEKKKEKDKELLKVWEPKLENVFGLLDVKKLQVDLLDTFVGYPRISCLDYFTGFNYLKSIFSTEAGQVKALVKFMKTMKNTLKKMHPDKLDNQEEFCVFAAYLYSFLLEFTMEYAFKSTLDGKSLKAALELLATLGFGETANKIFCKWKKKTVEDWVRANEATKEAEVLQAKKGKDKKGAKKDGKKEDKNEKSQKKKDGDGISTADDVARECDKYAPKDGDAYWTPDRADILFQMEYLGPYLERSMGGGKDPRVNFSPDGWQKQLLDIVDANESALVSAPTASGKTFICYYTMEKVLRNSNDGVAVYVAPNKALVNQVHAEVYTRFSSKNYPANSKYELMGLFLREVNSAGGLVEEGKWKYAQVLIVVPHIFEMLLLSPKHNDWVSRLRYVVFDEIHCIGEHESGIQWERVMQMIPCPFLALSATVANPDVFYQWQQRLNASKGLKQVHYVEHTERYNDLYKQVYYQGSMYRLHPFACLNERAVRRDGLADDMSLTPRENAQLYQVVDALLGDHSSWAKLEPTSYFKDLVFITKQDTRRYERDLKAAFISLVQTNVISSKVFQAIITGFQRLPKAKNEIANVKDIGEGKVDDEFEAENEVAADADKVDLTKVRYGETSYLSGAKLFQLFKQLDKTHNLPTLVFNFSRVEINSMMSRLTVYCEAQQQVKYYGDDNAKYRTKQINNERMKRFKEIHAQWQALKKMRLTDEGKAAVEEEPTPPRDVADEIDMEFSFHSAKVYGQAQEDIDAAIEKLNWRGTPKALINGLLRGIGMHHEACSIAYKKTVEMLFRKGYLQVVFATGTLALGINMPCRSIVFTGDHVELNGLMYRQMSGRAGRRGYDLFGNVIFFDVPFTKISQLVASELPFLSGELSFSPTTLLRSLLQISCMSDKFEEDEKMDKTQKKDALKGVIQRVAHLFQDPFFVDRNGVNLSKQMMMYARFSVEFLMREGLLDMLGKPHDMAFMASHLFEIEPANFMLNRLLRSGELHAYLKYEEKKVVEGDPSTRMHVKLAKILAHLLYRRRVTSSDKSAKPNEKDDNERHAIMGRRNQPPSKNCPVLDPLPDKIANVFLQYNADVFELYQEFVHSCSATEDIDETKDVRLPFAAVEVVPFTFPNGHNPFSKGSSFVESYGAQLIKSKSRSPFSACAGRGDKFANYDDMVSCTREHVVRLDYDTFPTIDVREKANSWLVDFLLHGRLKFLTLDNLLDAAESFRLVKNAELSLNLILECLKKACPHREREAKSATGIPKDIVYETMVELRDELKAKLNPEKGKAQGGG